MATKAKRGRTAKNVTEPEAESVEQEVVVKNGDAKKKPTAKGAKAAGKAKAVAEPEVEQVPEEKKKGRKGKAAAAVEPEPVAAEEPVKGRKGRKPAAAKEEAPVVVDELPAKKGRGKKTAEAEAPVSNGSSPAKVAASKGKGKAAKAAKEEEVVEPEPAAPAKRGRGKAKADTKDEEPAASPAKKSKQAAKEPSPKKASPKKAAVVEAVSEEANGDLAPAKAGGRGRKKAAEEKPSASPTKSPKAPAAKRGRGKKAAATEQEANGEAPAAAAAKKPAKEPKKRTAATAVETATTDEVEKPLDGVTQRKKAKTEPAKKPKAEKKPAAPKVNKSATDYASVSFDIPGGKEFNFKISSWNVAGLRSWVSKGGLDFFEHEKPDILCVQETKCMEDQLPEEARQVKGYHPYWLCKPGGYAGVAIYSKKMPINVTYGLGDEEQDADGRLLTAEYEKFYLVCVYVPNAGRGLVTLPKRMRWDEKFHKYLKDLDSKKPVVLCGDMNVAHEEIDLANPKSNKKNAGFTPEERAGMTKLLSLGFVDTFRQLYPDQTGAYTFWTYMGNARSKNVGWRLDYFITSERFTGKVVDHVIRSGVYGSDHCPLTLFLNV
ncbi:DNA-(apurinic or apyrimidinic site) endonuclease isoform X1 [Aedes albopictus]|uniref:DNA-(apurinic or apyrimidinic site) endonuclease n=1 Tax=Aedes albopictus TaxID=7160 RepID=A0ABM2A6M6_AEDAL|nr:DNA-(apurinic or apyrimidinic site) lyase-like isoform X1 [Aedes albopictus]